MNFEEAKQQLIKGKMLQREGWNGKGLFVFMQIPATIGIDIVEKMQSLPTDVKNEFLKRAEKEQEMIDTVSHLLKGPAITTHQNLNYNNQLALVDKDNNITGWSPSTTDALAEDWMLFQY